MNLGRKMEKKVIWSDKKRNFENQKKKTYEPSNIFCHFKKTKSKKVWSFHLCKIEWELMKLWITMISRKQLGLNRFGDE